MFVLFPLLRKYELLDQFEVINFGKRKTFSYPRSYIIVAFMKKICRTASRLRTACIASTFSRIIKSSIIYKIAPHQV